MIGAEPQIGEIRNNERIFMLRIINLASFRFRIDMKKLNDEPLHMNFKTPFIQRRIQNPYLDLK